MNIPVLSHDLGFFTQEYITVTRIEDGGIIFCNHAGADEEVVEHEVARRDDPDITWTSSVMVCDKCPAYKLPGENYWYDAPYEGVNYE